MPDLYEFKVLDAMLRESIEQRKRGDMSGRVQYSAIVNRVKKERASSIDASVPVQVSRYLKSAIKEGRVEKEKRGRKVFYWLTTKGKTYLMSSRDLLDSSRKWFEEPMVGAYLSYAMTPPEYGLIRERTYEKETFNGKEEIEELVKAIKEKNPNLESLYIRLDRSE
jgi:DNA-binding PadR family transcriptional regulator